jgi:tetratricopeptide (TPR) repeat protein
MSIRAWNLTALIIVALIFADQAGAADVKTWAECNEGDGSLRLAACTEIIRLGDAETAQNRSAAHNNRGNVYLAAREFDTAITEYTVAIEAEGTRAIPLLNRAIAFIQKGDTKDGSLPTRSWNDYRSAIADLSGAIAIDGGQPSYFLARGLTYWRLGELESAITDFTSAISLDPGFGPAYAGRAGAQTNLVWNKVAAHEPSVDVSTQAFADYKIALKLNTEDADSLNNRGYLLQALTRYKEAIADFKSALLRDELHLKAMGNLALAFSKSGQTEKFFEVERSVNGIIEKATRKGFYREPNTTGYVDFTRYVYGFGTVPVALPPIVSLVGESASATASTAVEPTQPLKKRPDAAVEATAGKRLALVIGNSDYQTSPLKNPRADAALMASTLRSVGFDVTEIIDADQTEMKQAMIDFGRKLRAGADVGLFYYAGHGVQALGKNYLIPVNASIAAEDEVAIQSVDLNDFLQTMETAGESRVNIVILDACRNNPFASSFRSASRGLSNVVAPSGTYLAFSTAPGSVAEDGDGTNSTYTKALAEAIMKPGLQVEDTFKEVRRLVKAATENRQVTWDSSSIDGEFYFRPAN